MLSRGRAFFGLLFNPGMFAGSLELAFLAEAKKMALFNFLAYPFEDQGGCSATWQNTFAYRDIRLQ